jgi:hypothetical protein
MQLITVQNTEHKTNLTVVISEEVLVEISVIKLTLIHITYYIYIYIIKLHFLLVRHMS